MDPVLRLDIFLVFTCTYQENLKVPGGQLNVNPARAITWFEGVTIYCTFFNNNSPISRQFLCNKITLKKISTVRGMLIKQIFELRGPGHPGSICNWLFS